MVLYVVTMSKNIHFKGFSHPAKLECLNFGLHVWNFFKWANEIMVSAGFGGN